MLWRHSKKETKVLLFSTLLFFSACALILSERWQHVLEHELELGENSVGVFAGVPENEVNTLLAQLDAREEALNAREMALVGRDDPVSRTELYLVSVAGVAMFGLILLNFYLDTRRRNSLA